jgi:hypothetical protein
MNILTAQKTITSAEIAVLMNRNHTEVMLEIGETLERAGIDTSIFLKEVLKGEVVLDLPRRELELATSGYPKHRLAMIDKWLEIKASDSGDSVREQVLSVIDSAGSFGATESGLKDFSRKFRGLKPSDQTRLIDLLVASGVIAASVTKNPLGGRPSKRLVMR